MRLLTPAWILVAGVWVAHASGFLQQVGPIFESADKIIGSVTDVRKLIPKQQPTVNPKPALHRSTARNAK